MNENIHIADQKLTGQEKFPNVLNIYEAKGPTVHLTMGKLQFLDFLVFGRACIGQSKLGHGSWKPTHHYCPSSLEKNFKFVSIEGGIISSSIDLWLLLWKEDVPTYLGILKILQNISDVFFYMFYRSVLALTETFKKDGLLTFT